MEYSYNFDTTGLPVHLFVKSQKQAKKVGKQHSVNQSGPAAYKRINKFRPTSYLDYSANKK